MYYYYYYYHYLAKGDHASRKTYDDFNEFFWSPSCLQYAHHHAVIEESHLDSLENQITIAEALQVNIIYSLMISIYLSISLIMIINIETINFLYNRNQQKLILKNDHGFIQYIHFIEYLNGMLLHSQY